MVKIGDLVTMRPGIQPPELYGAGLVLGTLGHNRLEVQWKTGRVGNCATYAVEVISRGAVKGRS